jgi:hypothetical protein
MMYTQFFHLLISIFLKEYKLGNYLENMESNYTSCSGYPLLLWLYFIRNTTKVYINFIFFTILKFNFFLNEISLVYKLYGWYWALIQYNYFVFLNLNNFSNLNILIPNFSLFWIMNSSNYSINSIKWIKDHHWFN